MAAERERFSLQLRLERPGLPLEFFVNTTRDIRTVLRSIEESRSGQPPHATWWVNADDIHITASVNGVGPEELQDIISDAYEGFRAGEGRQGEWPPTISADARQTMQRLVNRIKRTSPASLEADGHEPLRIEPRVQKRQKPTQVQYAAWSSIEGTLDVISVRRQPYFVIFEHATEYRVRCSFPDEFLPKVKDNLGCRVIAEGFIRYRHDGVPVSLTDPSYLERVPDPEVEDITEYRGTMPEFTNSLSSYEYVRQMRESEHD